MAIDRHVVGGAQVVGLDRQPLRPHVPAGRAEHAPLHQHGGKPVHPAEQIRHARIRQRQQELIQVDERRPVEPRGMVGQKMAISRQLPRMPRPVDQRHTGREPRRPDQAGAAIHAGIVVQDELLDPGRDMERQPFQQVGRLVPEDRADAQPGHGAPYSAAAGAVMRRIVPVVLWPSRRSTSTTRPPQPCTRSPPTTCSTV